MTKEKQLYRILFLASVFLLLINDLSWKYEFHNTLTGKLSDFAGLFAFPFFFASLFPKSVKIIYLFTAIFFIFWKLEISQPMFDFVNNLGIGINRTVDNTDFVALIILPFSYWYWTSNSRSFIKPRLIFKPIIIGICCFSFIATTLAKKGGEINIKSYYETEVKADLYTIKNSLNLSPSSQNETYIYHLNIPDKNAWISTSLILKENQKGFVNIKLDSILGYTIESNSIFVGGISKRDITEIEKMDKADFEKLFIEQLSNQLNK